MSCDRIGGELPLYHYGELSQEEEERVEQHLAACPACLAELERLRYLGRALTAAEPVTSDDLLQQCRADLARQLRAQAPAARQRPSWLASLRDFMNMGVGLRVPAGALALVALGFLGGKIAPFGLPFLNAGAQQAGIINVRSVESDASGGVRIGIENVSRKSLSGNLEDPQIRELLIAGMRDESNPGLRVEAADILKNHAGTTDVRNVLLEAVQHDPNVGVRMAALEGLKTYSAEPAVRAALTEALLNDANPGVRVKVIDLLTASRDESMVGPMQDLMRKENNQYVRMRVTNVLREMNASVGTF